MPLDERACIENLWVWGTIKLSLLEQSLISISLVWCSKNFYFFRCTILIALSNDSLDIWRTFVKVLEIFQKLSRVLKKHRRIIHSLPLLKILILLKSNFWFEESEWELFLRTSFQRQIRKKSDTIISLSSFYSYQTGLYVLIMIWASQRYCHLRVLIVLSFFSFLYYSFLYSTLSLFLSPFYINFCYRLRSGILKMWNNQ